MVIRIINELRQIYWSIFKPRTFGVKCLIEQDEKFLLVKNSYGDKHWTLPGGGVKRSETPGDAATREAKEETGLDISKLNLLGKYVSRSEGKLDTVYCYYCVAKKGSAININSKEILDAKWFLRSSLADNTSYAVKRCIKLLERRTT